MTQKRCRKSMAVKAQQPSLAANQLNTYERSGFDNDRRVVLTCLLLDVSSKHVPGAGVHCSAFLITVRLLGASSPH